MKLSILLLLISHWFLAIFAMAHCYHQVNVKKRNENAKLIQLINLLIIIDNNSVSVGVFILICAFKIQFNSIANEECGCVVFINEIIFSLVLFCQID